MKIMMLPRSDINLLDSGPGHSVFIAGAAGSARAAIPRREEDAEAAEAATAFLVGEEGNYKPSFQLQIKTIYFEF